MSDSEEHSVEEIIPMPKNRVRFTDMPLDLQEKAIRICDAADKLHNMDKEVASEIQKLIAADDRLGDETAGWHVIVGVTETL